MTSPATLPKSLYLTYHMSEPYPREVPLERVYADLDLPRGSGERPFVYGNMVQTFDGQAVITGSAFGIGTAVDHYLLRQLRVHADAVLFGAGTLRDDDVVITTHPYLQDRRREQGQSPNPLAIVASARCEFSEDVLAKPFFTRRDFQRLFVTTPQASPTAIARVQAAGALVDVVAASPAGRVDVPALMAHLAARGISRLLLEGGPTFNVAVARHEFLDELFVTSALHLGDDPTKARIFASPVTSEPLDLISEYRLQDPLVRELYFRFRFSPQRPVR